MFKKIMENNKVKCYEHNAPWKDYLIRIRLRKCLQNKNYWYLDGYWGDDGGAIYNRCVTLHPRSYKEGVEAAYLVLDLIYWCASQGVL